MKPGNIVASALTRTLDRFGYQITRKAEKRESMYSGLKALKELQIIPVTVLDVGASDGRWTKIAMEFFPDAEYFLYEPQPVHAAALNAFQSKHGPRVHVVRKAVGRKDGMVHFDVSDPQGGVVLEMPNASSMEVPSTSIDDSLKGLKKASPYMLKLDTHGYEADILEGAREILKETAICIIETYNYKISPDCLLFWELCAYLHERGFRPIDVVDVLHRTHDNTLWQMDIFFVRSDWPGFRHLFFT